MVKMFSALDTYLGLHWLKIALMLAWYSVSYKLSFSKTANYLLLISEKKKNHGQALQFLSPYLSHPSIPAQPSVTVITPKVLSCTSGTLLFWRELIFSSSVFPVLLLTLWVFGYQYRNWVKLIFSDFVRALRDIKTWDEITIFCSFNTECECTSRNNRSRD